MARSTRQWGADRSNGRASLLVAVAAVSATALAGCGSFSSDSSDIVDRPVSIRLISEIDTLDPAVATSVSSQQLQMLAYDRLTFLAEDGSIKPSLATSWTETPNGFAFTIDEGATCSDGTPVTATVVAKSLERFAQPENSGLYGGTVFGDGAPTINADDAAGMVTIKTASPFNEMLLGLAMPWSSIVCPAGLEKSDALQSGIYGSGPYQLTGSERGSAYTFEKREDYAWGPDGYSTSTEGVPTTVIFKPVENDTTAANQLAAGSLDVGVVRGADVERLEEDQSLSVQIALGAGQNVLLFNQGAGHATEDLAVRKAIAMAISRDDYIKAEAFGQGKPATSYFADFVTGFDPRTEDLVQPYSLEDARKTLADAGYAANSDGILERDGTPLAIKLISWSGQNSGPDYIVSQLSELGIDVSNQGGDLSAWSNSAVAGDFDIAVAAFSPPMPSFVMNTGPLEAIGYFDNPTWSAAVAAAPVATSQEEASAQWAIAQEALLKNIDIAPLYGNEWHWFGRSGVSFEVLRGSGLYVDPYSLRLVPAAE